MLQEILGGVQENIWDKREVSPPELERLEKCLQRREKGEPLQYILGTMDFRCITLKVDCRALIPRPETEGLVEIGLECIRDLDHPRVLDIGTGSGNIMLALLSEHATASAWACDASEGALQLARENGRYLDLNRRITWALADIYSEHFLEQVAARFDLVISNPPYVSEGEFRALTREIREFEPEIALVGGTDGLRAIRRLAQIGPRLLAALGHLVCEIGEQQGEKAVEIFTELGWQARVKKDLSGKDRYLIARRA